MSAMLENIEDQCANGLVIDFILATGDIAFSGKDSEYDLAELFINKLSVAARLPCEMIFCVPGNHDIQRERYTTLFSGAREKLHNATDVYTFLADREELNTLLLRQEGFSKFQNKVFAKQKRKHTADGLGYVSILTIDDLNIAIIGLNTAWLAEGGNTDERKIILGEPQVQSAIEISGETSPHLIIGMQHHPFDYLKRFDQRFTEWRIQNACHIFHCGHLHEPNAVDTLTQSGNCLTFSAGASFESRNFHNSYSVVSHNPFYAQSEVTFIQYIPSEGVFSYKTKRKYSCEANAPLSCNMKDLSIAIQSYCRDASYISYYLAGLLLGYIMDVPIQIDRAIIVFGSFELLPKLGESENKLVIATHDILAVGRAVRLLHKCKPLNKILNENGDSLRNYVNILRELCNNDVDLGEQIKMRNRNAAQLNISNEGMQFRFTLSLLDDLRDQGDWEELRELADRCSSASDSAVSARGKRSLALCYVRSTEQVELKRAKDLYEELIKSEHGEAEDFAALATLLANDRLYSDARVILKQGISKFPEKIGGFLEIGMKIVAATGDVKFREELRNFRNRVGKN